MAPVALCSGRAGRAGGGALLRPWRVLHGPELAEPRGRASEVRGLHDEHSCGLWCVLHGLGCASRAPPLSDARALRGQTARAERPSIRRARRQGEAHCGLWHAPRAGLPSRAPPLSDACPCSTGLGCPSRTPGGQRACSHGGRCGRWRVLYASENLLGARVGRHVIYAGVAHHEARADARHESKALLQRISRLSRKTHLICRVMEPEPSGKVGIQTTHSRPHLPPKPEPRLD